MTSLRDKGRAHVRLVAVERAPVAPADGTGAGPEEPKKRFAGLDDGQLIRSMREGDKGVATLFYDRVRPQIDRTLGRLFGRRDVDYEDLRQLVLIELVFTLHRFRGECSLDSWVSKLTGHIVFKHLRRRQIESRLFGVLERDDLLPPSTLGTPREPMVRSLMKRASRHLEEMDPDRAWAFILHDLLGYDLKELSGIMKVSVSAAQSRLVRGRRDIHQRIAGDPELADLLDEWEGDRS